MKCRALHVVLPAALAQLVFPAGVPVPREVAGPLDRKRPST